LTVLAGAPTLGVALNGSGQLAISWATGGPSYVLQATPNLSPPITWTNVGISPTLSNTQWVVTVATQVQSQFYRLALP